jgi:diaminopimelate decarboxylase
VAERRAWPSFPDADSEPVFHRRCGPANLLYIGVAALQATSSHASGRPMRTIYISGVHSGPNPSPGIGTARSLRAAYPDARLCAVDYSTRSSGIHFDGFDDVWLQRPWKELHLDSFRGQIERRLDDGGLWISGLDLETYWLAEVLPSHPLVLVPPRASLLTTSKPAFIGASALSVAIPHHVGARTSSWDLHSFCRLHGWNVWVKGPHYEAWRVSDWPALRAVLHELGTTWSREDLFVQAHVSGYEESVAFAAHSGRLLDCVYMRKCVQTPEGKTWAGRISDVPSELAERLRTTVEALSWTGGGELEFVRGADDLALNLIDWNPRFPAWIYGATLAGRNLPGLLVESVVGIPATATHALSQQFTRLVMEVPVHIDYPLPEPPPVDGTIPSVAKHPSGMPELWRHLRRDEIRPYSVAPTLPRELIDDLEEIGPNVGPTPALHWLSRTARMGFAALADAARTSEGITVRFAYSVKTNPDSRLLELARSFGLCVEVISEGELAHALAVGISADRIVLNGPVQPSGAVAAGALYVRFCDSIEALDSLLDGQGPRATVVGLRLRPVGVRSRFGIPLDEAEEFSALVARIQRFPRGQQLGLHFHLPSDAIGVHRWWRVYRSMLQWGRALQAVGDVTISALDVGGGWFPEDWSVELLPRLGELATEAAHHLPGLRELLLEPGKALAQPSMAVLARVVEVRVSRDGSREAVLDAAVSDLPMSRFYPHRVAIRSGSGWQALAGGEDRLLGRICMETDVLAEGLSIPIHIGRDDVMAILDAGAYDASMAYAFGQGRRQ